MFAVSLGGVVPTGKVSGKGKTEEELGACVRSSTILFNGVCLPTDLGLGDEKVGGAVGIYEEVWWDGSGPWE